MMGDRERERIEERLLANLITHVQLGRVLAGAELHEATGAEASTSGVRESRAERPDEREGGEGVL